MSHLCASFSYAQVERIGMKGTADFKILAQLGNVLYATSGDWNNYYRSIDEGDTWSLFIDSLPVSGINTTSLYTVDTTVYFPSNNGEYRSSNSLNSWTFYKYPLVADTLPQYIFHKGEDTLFTIISYYMLEKDGFYFSSDKGVHWEKRTLPTNDKVDYASLTIANNRLLLPSYQLNDSTIQYGIIISDDFGKTWENVNNGFPDSLITYAGMKYMDGNIFLRVSSNSGSGLYQSKDGGNNWNITLWHDSDWYNAKVLDYNGKIYFETYDFSKNSALYISEDTGKTWKKYFQDTIHRRTIFFPLDQRMIAETDSNRHFLVTKNGTIPFFAKNGFYQSMSIYHISGDTIYASNLTLGNPGDSIYVSYDNGDIWSTRQFISNRTCKSWLFRDGSLYSFAVGLKDTFGYIYHSIDGGKSWDFVNVVPKINYLLLTHYTSIDVQDDTIMVNVSMKGQHFISIDRGKSWVDIGGSIPGYLYRDIRIHNGALLYLDDNHILHHSFNLGATWDTFPLYPLLHSISLPFKPLFTGNLMYVAMTGLNAGIIRTSDAGLNWLFARTGFPYYSVVQAFTNFNNRLYAQVDYRIYYSLDSGAIWRQLSDHLFFGIDIAVNKSYIFVSSSDHLYRIPLQTLSVPSHPNQSPSPFLIDRINPNPANETVSIHYSLTEPQSKLTLNIFDVTGKLCGSFAVPAFQGEHDFKFDVGKYSSGNYTLSLSNRFFDSRQKLDILH
jgi:photosystem II stability/assembly factor-like uncharacterized protein